MQMLELLFVALTALALSHPAFSQPPAKQKAVLVTGGSSGIGLAITQLLSKNGLYVYATARKDEDVKRLDAMDNVSGLPLDVNRQAEIDAAVKFVEAQGRGLYGSDNAGAGHGSPRCTDTHADCESLRNYPDAAKERRPPASGPARRPQHCVAGRPGTGAVSGRGFSPGRSKAAKSAAF